MIAAARAAGGRTGSGEEIRWVVGEAEGLEGVLERGLGEGEEWGDGGGGVNMITAGMAVSLYRIRLMIDCHAIAFV